ncbi:fatty-acyl-CoA synthase [Amycolatopsis sacchari]|uniref:Fatty-acyl-CoA synthase n=1 Tax=Amycolatopsis sacchari TaxID=115433 RepID=A0A1I3XDG6_9PSEU|nr:fatty-acyl-CoA synthase [Amycolatopsis sacchari]
MGISFSSFFRIGNPDKFQGEGKVFVPDEVRTVADVLARLDRPERGLTFPGGRAVPFTRLRELTADAAARWPGLGARRGDRVVLVVADEYEFAVAFLSALRAGVVAVPVFPPFRAGQRESYRAHLHDVVARTGAVCCVVGEPIRRVLGDGPLAGRPVHGFAGLLAAPPGPVQPPEPEDLAVLQFSSGSTGTPKAVAVSHRALLATLLAIQAGLRIDGSRDRAVSWLPLYHDMGLVGFLLTPLIDQLPTWYLPPLRFARDPVSWLRLITEVRGTLAFAPNFAYGLLTRRAKDADIAALDLSSWRVAGCGAEPVRAATLRAFADRFAPAGLRRNAFLASYGLAEATLAVTLTPCDEGLTTFPDGELVSCGVPVEGATVRVVGPDGQDLPDGTEGEIVVSGPGLADGYFGDPAATARAFRDGRLHTGDLGLLRENRLYVTGRIKDVIVINGVNYHPQDIELAASEVPGVRPGNVAALAVRDEHTEGVRLAVAASRAVDRDRLAEQVRRAVRSRLGLTVGEVVVVGGDLPKTSSGKLRRAHTAELLANGGLVAR